MGSFRPAARNLYLHRYCSFAESLAETVSNSLRHSCGSELHVDPPLLVALTITSRSDGPISRSSVNRRLPETFIPSARSATWRNPGAVRCAPSRTSLHTFANRWKSFAFPDISGTVSKCGMILVTRSSMLRTSYFTVRSLRSGRIVPQPKCRRISVSTSERSAFWLTEKLGLTSHPTRSLGRGEKETVKQPSPSTYPEIYEGMSIKILPASWLPCGHPRYLNLSRYGVNPATPHWDRGRLPSVSPSHGRTPPFGLHRY